MTTNGERSGQGWLPDGRHWGYSAFTARLLWVEDHVGNRMTFGRPNNSSYVSRVTSPNGRYVDVAYNTAGFIASLTDNLGRQFTYGYSGGPLYRLQTVTDPNGKTRQYGWDANDFLTKITDPDGNVMVQNTMETVLLNVTGCGAGASTSVVPQPTGRVLSQSLTDGSTFKYSYATVPLVGDCGGSVSLAASPLTQVTDRRGTVRKVVFDNLGNVTSNTAALGKAEQQVTSYVYDSTTNLLMSRTDALGRQTTYQYDANGSLTQTTRLAGTANAVKTSATTWTSH